MYYSKAAYIKMWTVVLAVAVFTIGVFYVVPQPSYKKRIEDLTTLKLALERYKAKNGAYPVSDFTSICSPAPSNENWIPGLVPHYLDKLPRDPRHNDVPNQQYLYVSDGSDYKIISHGPDDLQVVAKKYPQLIDPKRQTWAYGYWTEGAKDW